MKKIKYIIFILLVIFSLEIFAQQNTDKVLKPKKDTFNNSLGFSAGISTGAGLSYRHYFKDFGIQTTFISIGPVEDLSGSLGISLLKPLIYANNINFYAYQGNHFFLESRINRFSIHGLGLGLEFIKLEHLGFNLMWGAAYYYHHTEEHFLSLTGEIGIFYKF
jgi:hypothetical protein